MLYHICILNYISILYTYIIYDYIIYNIRRIAYYIQIADVPGRNQPGTGELNYNFIFKEIKKLKYDGHIGLECWPKGKDPEEAIRDLLASVDGLIVSI